MCIHWFFNIVEQNARCDNKKKWGDLIFSKTTCLWTVMQRPVLASHFHALKNDHMTGASMQFSLWREIIDGTSRQISRIAMQTLIFFNLVESIPLCTIV
jgi:hypothetical protein